MYNGCSWLSEPLKLKGSVDDDDVIEELYKLYTAELRDSVFTFKGKVVKYRSNPPIKGKDEGFYHIISGYRGDPVIEERAKRLLWGKEILLHTPCPAIELEKCCEGLWVWKTDKNECSTERVHIFHPKVNYLVILEERPDYWVYITSYRIGDTHKRRELKLEYKKKKWL